jgi:hypothetical protein
VQVAAWSQALALQELAALLAQVLQRPVQKGWLGAQMVVEQLLPLVVVVVVPGLLLGQGLTLTAPFGPVVRVQAVVAVSLLALVPHCLMQAAQLLVLAGQAQRQGQWVLALLLSGAHLLELLLLLLLEQWVAPAGC